MSNKAPINAMKKEKPKTPSQMILNTINALLSLIIQRDYRPQIRFFHTVTTATAGWTDWWTESGRTGGRKDSLFHAGVDGVDGL